MKIKHVLIDDNVKLYNKTVKGLIEIKVYYHGGDSENFIAQGEFTERGFSASFKSKYFEINESTSGVAGISFVALYTVVEEDFE